MKKLILEKAANSTILIVDDEPANIQLIYKIISSNYKILMATNHTDALNVIRKNIPDLVLLDVVMPEVDGLEICRIIKQDKLTADIPVIFITSLQEDQEQEKCWEAGGDDFVSKPISPTTLINRVKLHLKQKHSLDLMSSLAFLDGLTQLNNRRFFDQFLHKQVLLAKRNTTSLSLLIIDIDNFKQFNDTYGHPAGDEALKQVARVLTHCCQRPTDCVARYGGEEFAVILPNTDKLGVISIASNILASLMALKIPHKDSVTPYMTASIGISLLEKGTYESLIESADKQLYKAKHNGKNRYEIDA